MKKTLLIIAVMALQVCGVMGQDKFAQMYDLLATPNTYRTASGAPGHEYWQQRADYVMDIKIDESTQKLYGNETITYFNQSPDVLHFLWLQLDQNKLAPNSDANLTETGRVNDRMGFGTVGNMYYEFDGGFKIEQVKDISNKDLPFTINQTMMRVDLPTPLRPGQSVQFKIKWWYNIGNRLKDRERSGYEYFEAEDNYLFTIAQFFPRMCVYDDVEGWQNKQFLGSGEFTLPFGNYKVSITVPADHIVGATGEIQNPQEVLSAEQRKRFEKAKLSYDTPVMIVNEQEARENEKEKSTGTKTWVYAAQNVRDFAFVASRKFIWDAMGVKFGDRTVLAMSYYPKEGNPLWEKYSTRVVAHTLKSYSSHTFDYPYPIAISVHTDQIGMEYPMICFNGGRPEADGTYSERTKYGMISVIIHEVGHNFFPMIVNSDERQWTWMDEGLNSFMQYLAEQEWERGYPSRRGPAPNIVDYMGGDKSLAEPIMSNSESVKQLGNNAYGKPATALNILRETVMGRELFDFAFKEYSRRWMFKHPTPEDFFRTMEDASGVDLDWFWRGWFFTVEHVDMALGEVKWLQVNSLNPETEKNLAQNLQKSQPRYISDIRNEKEIKQTVTEADTSMLDFYNKYDKFGVNALDKREYEQTLNQLSPEERKLLGSNDHFYEMNFENKGGLVMPVILEFEYEDGTKEIKRIPAEVWRRNTDKISKVFITKLPIKRITLDPFLETADIDTENNIWPPVPQPTRFQMFKERRFGEAENLMQREMRAKKLEEQMKNPNKPSGTN